MYPIKSLLPVLIDLTDDDCTEGLGMFVLFHVAHKLGLKDFSVEDVYLLEEEGYLEKYKEESYGRTINSYRVVKVKE